MQRLTARQAEVLRFITAHQAEHGYPPTLREIAAHMGIRSTNGANDYLVALERKGRITREVNVARGIKVTGASLGSRTVTEAHRSRADGILHMALSSADMRESLELISEALAAREALGVGT